MHVSGLLWFHAMVIGLISATACTLCMAGTYSDSTGACHQVQVCRAWLRIWNIGHDASTKTLTHCVMETWRRFQCFCMHSVLLKFCASAHTRAWMLFKEDDLSWIDLASILQVLLHVDRAAWGHTPALQVVFLCHVGFVLFLLVFSTTAAMLHVDAY